MKRNPTQTPVYGRVISQRLPIALHNHEKRGSIWSINDADFAKARLFVTADRPKIVRCWVGLNPGHRRILKEQLNELRNQLSSYAFSEILGVREELIDPDGARVSFFRPPAGSLLVHDYVGLDESNGESIEVGDIGSTRRVDVEPRQIFGSDLAQ